MRTIAIVATVLVVALATPAHADRDPLGVLSAAAAHSYAGQHVEAIALYEQVFRTGHDPEILVLIAGEYRALDQPLEAIQQLCAYLTIDPEGPRAAFATAEVRTMHAERGIPVHNTNVCAPVQVAAAPAVVSAAPAGAAATAAPAGSSISLRERAGIGAAAVGVIGVVAGVYFASRANQISNELANHDLNQPWPANISELEHEGHDAGTLGIAFLISGGVALATGGILYFTGRADRRATERMSITPSVSTAGGGLVIGGGF